MAAETLDQRRQRQEPLLHSELILLQLPSRLQRTPERRPAVLLTFNESVPWLTKTCNPYFKSNAST